jgi:hypothetical protein
MDEADEIQSLVMSVVQSGGATAGSVYDRYKAVVSNYNNQKHVLTACQMGFSPTSPCHADHEVPGATSTAGWLP